MKKQLVIILIALNGFVLLFSQIVVGKGCMVLMGNTTLSWAFTVALTLGGFALGYFLSVKESIKSKTILLLFFQALLVFSIPFLNNSVYEITSNYKILQLLLVISCPYLFIVVLSALITTGLIKQLSNSKSYVSGNVMFIATIFGAIAVLLTTYYMIPNFGLKLSCLIVSSIIIIILVFNLLIQKIKA